MTSKATSRALLLEETAEEFRITCDQCGKKTNIHVNDVKAEEDYTYVLVAIGLCAVATLALWDYIGVFGLLPWLIPFYLWQKQTNETKHFNQDLITTEDNISSP